MVLKMRTRGVLTAVLSLALGCSDPSGGGASAAWFEDAGSDGIAGAFAGADGSTPADSAAGPLDASLDAAHAADVVDVGAGVAAFVPDPAPTGRLWPVPGELTLVHLGVDSFLPKMGEATVVVGPDGTMAWIDVGNDKHAKQIVALVETLNTKWLTPARGYAARKPRQVEWVVLTYFHADHGGGLEALLQEDLRWSRSTASCTAAGSTSATAQRRAPGSPSAPRCSPNPASEQVGFASSGDELRGAAPWANRRPRRRRVAGSDVAGARRRGTADLSRGRRPDRRWSVGGCTGDGLRRHRPGKRPQRCRLGLARRLPRAFRWRSDGFG